MRQYKTSKHILVVQSAIMCSLSGELDISNTLGSANVIFTECHVWEFLVRDDD